MNKLLLNRRARNHIRFFPMKDTISNLPESESDRIKWCEAEFKRLERNNDAKRLVLHKNKAKGYLISVWQMDNLYYLILCLRNEFKTFNDTIYINSEREDTINIAKFLRDNVDQIMSDYKKQLLDARDELLKNAVVGEANDA